MNFSLTAIFIIVFLFVIVIIRPGAAPCNTTLHLNFSLTAIFIIVFLFALLLLDQEQLSLILEFVAYSCVSTSFCIIFVFVFSVTRHSRNDESHSLTILSE